MFAYTKNDDGSLKYYFIMSNILLRNKMFHFLSDMMICGKKLPLSNYSDLPINEFAHVFTSDELGQMCKYKHGKCKPK